MSILGRPKVDLATRFWCKVDKSGECWLWCGALSVNGYGMIWVKTGDASHKVHRLSWEMAYGEIPEGMLVCHRCDVRRCVRPEHLFLGTHQENSTDMVSKGRSIASSVGEEHHLHKLTIQDVKDIRAWYAKGDVTYAEIAAHYGVRQPTIGSIVRGEAWKHVG